MLVKPLEKLLAFKALALAKGLSVSERRVAAAIVDHFNGISGRCDPSIDCLAEELGIDRRTVIRCVRKLDRLEIIFKDRHQGRHRTNSYEPNWQKLREMLATWQLGGKWKRRTDRGTISTSRKGQSGHSSGDSGVTQICSRNPVQESVRPGNVADDSIRSGEGMVSNGPARRPLAKTPYRAPRRIASREAADQSALRRWEAELLKLDAALYQAIVIAIDDSAVAAITAAEVRRHGGGLQYILENREQLLAKRDGHG